MKTRSPVSDALVRLRAGLGETQQQFANRMHTAITTIARYETFRPPKGKALAELERIAVENNLLDCAEVFRRALADELGVSLANRRVTLQQREGPAELTVEQLYDLCVKETNESGLTISGIRLEFDRSDGSTLVAELALPKPENTLGTIVP